MRNAESSQTTNTDPNNRSRNSSISTGNRYEGTPSSLSSAGMRRTPSSGGFGRIRIESPDYRLNSPSYQNALERIRQQRLHQEGLESQHKGELLRPLSMQSMQSFQGSRRHSFVDRTSTNTPPPIIESTPLLDFQYARELHGTLIDSGSVASKSSMFEPGQEAPPLLQWIGPALLCALAYALYNIFIKKGSAGIHPILGGVILQFVAAILGSILCLTLVYGPTQEELFYNSTAIWYSVCAGISVGAAEIISFMVSGMGVQAVQSIPTIIGGSVFFGTVLGWMMLNETLSLRGWFGVAMIAGGITLVGLDPGASLE